MALSMTRRLALSLTALNVLVASGFALAGLIRPQAILPSPDTPTAASAIFAMYAAARTIPLAAFVLVAIWRQWTQTVLILGLLAGVIQLLDGFVGLAQHDIGKTIGPFVIAILQFYAVAVLRNGSASPKRQ